MSLKEEELYFPVKQYLEKNGYTVNAEVHDCDILATKGDDIVIIELKTRFSLKLIYQGIDRQKVSDSVYIAVAVTHGTAYPAHFRYMKLLVRRLELGLILVHFLRGKKRIEVVAHPAPYERKKSNSRKRAILRESGGRFIEMNIGGTRGKKKLTLYRQFSIEIAVFLDLFGQSSPKELVRCGCSEKSQSILSNNFYGWFQRESRGFYSLHKEGRAALADYPELVLHFKKQFETDNQKGNNRVADS